MQTFTDTIQAHETQLNTLHAALHEAVAQRHGSPHKHNEWTKAVRRFHAARSQVDEMCDACLSDGLTRAPILRQFAFEYLAVDPHYFRSGYFVEKLLRRIKRLHLTTEEQHILQKLVLKRIKTGALRNFRQICRLIRIAETHGFLAEVSVLASSDVPDVRRRATFALQYFPRHGNSLGADFRRE